MTLSWPSFWMGVLFTFAVIGVGPVVVLFWTAYSSVVRERKARDLDKGMRKGEGR